MLADFFCSDVGIKTKIGMRQYTLIVGAVSIPHIPHNDPITHRCGFHTKHSPRNHLNRRCGFPTAHSPFVGKRNDTLVVGALVFWQSTGDIRMICNGEVVRYGNCTYNGSTVTLRLSRAYGNGLERTTVIRPVHQSLLLESRVSEQSLGE